MNNSPSAKSAAPTSGWYVLRVDVNNPAPDKRSRDAAFRPIWPQGTRVKIERNDPVDVGGRMVEVDSGRIHFMDRSTAAFCLREKAEASLTKGNGILEAVDTAAPALGQMLRDGGVGAGTLLAKAVDAGLVTLDDVQRLSAEVGSLDEAALDLLDRKHWLG